VGGCLGGWGGGGGVVGFGLWGGLFLSPSFSRVIMTKTEIGRSGGDRGFLYVSTWAYDGKKKKGRRRYSQFIRTKIRAGIGGYDLAALKKNGGGNAYQQCMRNGGWGKSHALLTRGKGTCFRKRGPEENEQ